MMMPSAPLPPSISGQEMGRVEIQRGEERGLARPVKYDLPGIKERMRKRLEEMKEVGRRHEQDADRACDDMVESQGEIDKAEDEVPRLAAKHRFYQELRGYVTDYTECYDEKVGTINYLESRLSKVGSERRTRLKERRRQDVKDQAEQLAAMTATAAYLGVSGTLGAEPGLEEAKKARQAEREGRRTRRRQAREGRGELRHMDGLSSDDELSPKEQAQATSAKKEGDGGCCGRLQYTWPSGCQAGRMENFGHRILSICLCVPCTTQDLLTNCAASPAILVSIHVYCCYIGTAVVLSACPMLSWP